ncbi:hydantoinase/oxoprolinase family protein [Bradyrhizobium canariense]|uniref:hydantoinase/oxoprolinase family protein n=1 Tax=Bradyrhizobium canariense TaxID=255045 RepID=UPI001CA5375C|nr:hydantoinase/oxoprolinase family protein [Bradyrhizobium canariense]MBW5435759.1 hydantoinase/oxoprolinase family protein [Bradyrhizobium canariense]
MRLACDTGGTFTDLIVEYDDGAVKMFKAATVPSDPAQGVIDAAAVAAADEGASLRDFLGRCELLVHGTTHAINAIITGRTAKTALLTTAGHPDILTLREGGRSEPFNFRIAYPAPYIPRALTFEVKERVNSAGAIVEPLDEAALARTIHELSDSGAEAVAVCLLWSIANSAHELRIGEALRAQLPHVPFTLSHQVNPTLREYRRASSAAIDASLKPLMSRYLGGLVNRLTENGFGGRALVLTSQGGMMDADELAKQPIHAINSGPSMAPIAGRYYAGLNSSLPVAIVADTGGTTYDVSVVRRGRIPKTRETWIGNPYRGHMTGFPSIDIKSVGAGGGSIASVDAGGVLHVGPKSAGSVPGPVCYSAGGKEPTLTDASLVLGHLDPDYFLGGRMKLDIDAAQSVINEKIAKPLGLSLMEAASSIVEVATENMVQAIEEITINQGIDPSEAALIGGGGAAGFNSVFIARRLQSPLLIMPETGAALSCAGALMSDLRDEYRSMFFVRSSEWKAEAVNAVLGELRQRCFEFLERAGKTRESGHIEFAVEARYQGQVWEIEIPVHVNLFATQEDLDALVEDFHVHHREVFAVRDDHSAVEFVCWTAAVSAGLRKKPLGRLQIAARKLGEKSVRQAYFRDAGLVETPVVSMANLKPGVVASGPAVVETPFTTIVIDPGASYWLEESGSLLIKP